jgi:hypothetical protein
MKRIISTFLAFALLVGVMLTLVSCGGLSGTYEGQLFDLKFKGESVSIVVGEGEDKAELKGTYEIEEKDGKKTISFDFVDEDEANEEQRYILGIADAILGGKVGFEEDGDKIKIGSWPVQMVFTKK